MNEDKIKNYLEACPNKAFPMDLNSIAIQWSKAGIGFGLFTFYVKDGSDKLHCDNETMSREFVKEMLCLMVDQSEFDDVED